MRHTMKPLKRQELIRLKVLREDQVISNPDAEEVILQGDLLIVFGLREQLHRLEEVAANIIKFKSENIQISSD